MTTNGTRFNHRTKSLSMKAESKESRFYNIKNNTRTRKKSTTRRKYKIFLHLS